jgi:soluble lytic murein transglycosylase-like protein
VEIVQTQSLATATNPATQPSRAAESAKLRDAAQQFEALFVNLLLKSMRSTVIESDLIQNKSEMKTYRQLLDQEMAKQMARGPQGLGIAELIYSRFEAHLAAEPAATDETPAAPADARSAPAAGTTAPLPEIERRRALRAYAVGRDAPPATRIPPRSQDLLQSAQRLSPAAADTVGAYGEMIDNAAARTGVPRELILAVIMGESSGAADAVSPVGAQGLMQLMPETAGELGVSDPFDPRQNIEGGARYLAWLRRSFGGDLDLVLAGYNAGPGRVARAGNRVPNIAETRDYVRKIGDMYRTLRGDAEDTAGKDGS